MPKTKTKNQKRKKKTKANVMTKLLSLLINFFGCNFESLHETSSNASISSTSSTEFTRVGRFIECSDFIKFPYFRSSIKFDFSDVSDTSGFDRTVYFSNADVFNTQTPLRHHFLKYKRKQDDYFSFRLFFYLQ